MRHYLEITLLPNPEVNIHFLWSKVYQQIHLGLVEMQDAQRQVPIGVSFPEYAVGEKFSLLGGKCRLFAQNEADLARFDAPKRLSRLSDYVHCTGIRPVPEKPVGHATYQRLHPKTNPLRLARRYAKRHGLDFETAFNGTVELRVGSPGGESYPKSFRYCEMQEKRIATPFIRLQSLSNGQTFCLWIKKTLVSESTAAGFSSYGLSGKAAVPEF